MSQLVHWMRTWPRLYTHSGQSSHKVYWMRNRTNASHVADKPLSRFDEWGHDQDLTCMVNTPLSGFTKWGQQYSKTRSCLLWTRSWRTCCWHFFPLVTHLGKENCSGILPVFRPVYTSMHLWTNQFKEDTCLTPPRCKLPRACLIVLSTCFAQGCPSTSSSYICMGKWDQIRNSLVRPSADITCLFLDWIVVCKEWYYVTYSKKHFFCFFEWTTLTVWMESWSPENDKNLEQNEAHSARAESTHKRIN